MLAASSAALAEETQWESPEGSFPDHGSCHYLGASGSLAAGGGVSGDLQRSTTRTLETQRVLAMLPPRRDARIPFQSQRDPVLAAASAGTCSGIDDCVEHTATAAGVALAELTTDAEFLRRATLDLTGRIPTKQDVLAFLADTSDDKREAVVDSLLERSEWADRWAMVFGDHFRNTWRTAQVNRYQNGRDSFHLYLLESMRENKPYDQMAQEMLAAEGTSDGRVYPERFETAEQHTNTYRNYEDNPVRASAVGYVVGGRTDGGPIQDTYDTLAFFTARDFLGVSTLECVLCHDGANHLEDVSVWGTAATRLQAWQMAAFFSDIPRLQSWRVPRSTLPLDESGVRVVANYYTIRDLDPGQQDVSRFGDTAGVYLAHTDGGNRPDRWYDERYVQPQYPFEGAATIDSGLRLREQLGAHLTADLQFARAAVNFIWKEFFSRGIVEPADHFDLERMDPGSPPPTGWEVQPSHPHLLDWLAENFRDHGFDLKWLMREIATSQTYQLSSRYDGVFSPRYEQYFVRHQAKRLERGADSRRHHHGDGQATGIQGFPQHRRRAVRDAVSGCERHAAR